MEWLFIGPKSVGKVFILLVIPGYGSGRYVYYASHPKDKKGTKKWILAYPPIGKEVINKITGVC
ncbi:MAG: hypothetical protein GY714_28730 [Desulfobacterales bacterium]|nr:hypothetical protein [Desulfobacterales bacterium]